MTQGLRRYYGADHCHFITTSCYHRRQFLQSAALRDLLLQVLEEVRVRYTLVVLGYVVMPEHFDLLITEPQLGDPSKAMQALKQRFTRRALRHYRDVPNPFWQGRFYDFNVWTEYKRIEKLRNIHRNPVTRGLVATPEEWAWSSFRFYAFGQSGPVKINDWELLKMRITKTTSSSPEQEPTFAKNAKVGAHKILGPYSQSSQVPCQLGDIVHLNRVHP